MNSCRHWKSPVGSNKCLASAWSMRFLLVAGFPRLSGIGRRIDARAEPACDDRGMLCASDPGYRSSSPVHYWPVRCYRRGCQDHRLHREDAMKLLRYGPPGAEKPGMLDNDGIIRCLSSIVRDIDGFALSEASLKTIASIDPTTLPRV